MSQLKNKEDYVFWIVITVSIIGVVLLLRANSPRCLHYDTLKEKVTYYDFSQSGTGITEGYETRYICTQWEEKPKNP